MDIQIASNFERLLYDVKDCNSEVTKDVMAEIKNKAGNIEKGARVLNLAPFSINKYRIWFREW